MSGPTMWDSEKPQSPAFKSDAGVPQALWPLIDQEELKRQVDIGHVHEALPSHVGSPFPSQQMLQIAPLSLSLSLCSVSLSS